MCRYEKSCAYVNCRGVQSSSRLVLTKCTYQVLLHYIVPFLILQRSYVFFNILFFQMYAEKSSMMERKCIQGGMGYCNLPITFFK